MPREDGDEQAFTGLEATIVFITFVVVASVFAYVVLGAGMFASQKSQETMHAGLEEAGSALCPGNTVIAKLDDDQGRLDIIAFDLETANDLAAIDRRNMTYTIATTETLVTFLPGDPRATEGPAVPKRFRKHPGNGGDRHGDPGYGRRGHRAGDTFTVEMTAAGGATASLTQTIPAGIEKNVYIELF